MVDERLERWLDAVLSTPGLTAIRDRAEARRALLDDALRGVEVVQRFEGGIVDVGSGGGTPGIPLAATLQEREVTLLESNGRKCEFLRSWEAEFPNVRVVEGRAEEQPVDAFGVAVAKALAPPPVAAEWCLPLVRPGGAAILWVGPSADPRLSPESPSDSGGGPAEELAGLLVLPKLEPTPAGLSAPARPGPETSVGLSTLARRMPGKIYALANQKGGVGKTTTAVNVAACLAEAGERVLVVDLDPQANATSGLGERANGVSSADLLDGAPLATLTRATRFPRLDLVPAKADLAGTAADLARREGAEHFLADALGDSGLRYAFVFVDCPPALGPLTVNALAAADRVLVPVQAEYYALEGLSQLLSLGQRGQRAAQPAPRARRRAADDGRRPHAALGRCRGRARAPSRRARLPHAGAALGAAGRGAEPRPARDRLRPALRRRRGLLEGGDGACRAFLSRSDAASAAASRSCSAAAPASPSSPTCRSR